MPKEKDQSSGFILIEDDKVTWRNDDRVFASFNLSEIVVIGEFTNSNGQFYDDWFLTFIKQDGSWIYVSWYAENIEGLEQCLCKKFQPDFNVSYLTNSTNYKSVVRYPEHLKGLPLFDFFPPESFKVPKNLFERIIKSLKLGFYDPDPNFNLTKEVKEELKKIK